MYIVSYRSSGYAIEQAFNLIKLLISFEGREIGITELASISGLNFKTVQKYIETLRKMGIVVLEPRERKNIVYLTEKGKCIARCLLG